MCWLWRGTHLVSQDARCSDADTVHRRTTALHTLSQVSNYLPTLPCVLMAHHTAALTPPTSSPANRRCKLCRTGPVRHFGACT